MNTEFEVDRITNINRAAVVPSAISDDTLLLYSRFVELVVGRLSWRRLVFILHVENCASDGLDVHYVIALPLLRVPAVFLNMRKYNNIILSIDSNSFCIGEFRY